MQFTNSNATNPIVITAYSKCALGDSLIDFIFFSQIAKYIENANIHINYHCKESHHDNLQLFNSSKNIHILPRNDIGYQLWQGTERLTSEKPIEDILCDMFNKFLVYCRIPIVLNTFEYKDENLLIKKMHLSQTYDLDMVIINSTPTSGQFIHDKQELNCFIIELNKKYKIATTEYINDSIISLHKQSVREIAAIAKTVKTIIAINTGPSLGLYNSEILDAVDNVYILDTTNHYRFKTRKFTKIRNIKDLSFLL